jgi:hypothetical protein
MSAAGRIIDHLGPLLVLQQRKRFRKITVLIVDGTLVPTRDRAIADCKAWELSATKDAAAG